MTERSLLALTEQIYDAATGDTPWRAVGDELCRVMQAQSAALMVGDVAGGNAELVYHGDLPLDAVLAYRVHYRSVDLWTNRAAAAARIHGAAARPRVWIGGTLVPDSEFLRSEFYSDFGRPLGLRYVVGTVVPLGAAGMMPIGLHRPEGAAPFEPHDAQLLERLLPHLRRAMQLRHRFASSQSAISPSIAALDALSEGVLVVDAEMRVIVANASAEAMATLGQSIRFVRGGNGYAPCTSLKAVQPIEAEALLKLVRATALHGAAGGAVPLRDAEGSTVAAVLVSPLPRRLASSPIGLSGRVAGQALLILRDLRPNPSPPGPKLLRDLFGLTPAEAEVAYALAGGATKEAVAARRGASEATIRTQVRSILAKTGASNLRDLERLLGTLRVV